MSQHSYSFLLAAAWCLSYAAVDAFSPSSAVSLRRCKCKHDVHVVPLPSTLCRMSSFEQLDDSNMKDILFGPSDGRAVLVDACTAWCGPCKLIEPYLTEAAKKHSDKLSVIKYDVEGDNNKNLKVEMLLQGVMVRALPTLILYSNGSPLATHSGAITETALEEWLDENFAKIQELEAEVKQSTAATQENMTSRKEDGNELKESESGGKRGFVSFAASQRDDYMLSAD